MNLKVYEPFSLINRMHRELSRVLDDSRVVGDEPAEMTAGNWSPAVDIREEDDRFLVHADLPGVKADDIEIDLDNSVLTIKGERKFEEETNEKGWHRVERFRGTFARRFSLPSTVDVEGITAKSSEGVLEVSIPKSEIAKPKRITVQS